MLTLASFFATPPVLLTPKVAPLPSVGFDPSEMMQEYGVARKKGASQDHQEPDKLAA